MKRGPIRSRAGALTLALGLSFGLPYTPSAGATGLQTPPTAWTGDLAVVLPPEEQVRTQLAQLPVIQAAMAGQRVAQGRQARLEAGPHEWTLRTGAQQRREVPGPHYLETEVALERGLRSAGKREADQNLGRTEVELGQLTLADTWHEAARELLRTWFDGLREQQAARILESQTQLAQQQLGVIQRRQLAGEAPRLEVLQAEAELARVQGAWQQAQARARLARSALQRRYPLLASAEASARSLPEPAAPTETPEVRVEHMLADNHEIELAETQARQAALQARRVGLEKQGDPVLGVHASRERGGQEQVLGVYVSLPLGSAGRLADEQVALAQAEVAEQKLAEVRQRVRSEAWQVALQAHEAPQAWHSLEAGRQGLEQAAALATRAYTLGELPLGEALQARRLALEARLTAEAARLDALESEVRLLLDSHEIWTSPEADH